MATLQGLLPRHASARIDMMMTTARRLASSTRRLRSSTQLRCTAATHATDDQFTITTPLYYVNAAPHMGSAYPTIAADTAARFQRLLGRKVRFITGTDEHGEKIALAAATRGMEPKQHCDDIARSYTALWSKLDISYDAFIRTTAPQHEALVREVLNRVWAKGDIYKADYEGWYCVDCEEFKDEKEMDDHHNCPTHRKPCQHRKEGNYFFKLSNYQKQIEELLSSDNGFVEPASRRNELLALVKEGVRDFSISRSAVSWGIPIPQDPAQTVYVWFDALIGYLSGLTLIHPPAESAPGEGPANAVDTLTQQGWPASVHIIGKDILRFHAVYWPGMLMSAGLPIPKKVFGHGFLTKDGLKMGKALGNTLDPQALVDTYGADAVRYYFMSEIIFGSDGDFSEQRFCENVNAALANNLGNMLNRTVSLLAKYCDKQVPFDLSTVSEDHPIRHLVQTQVSVAGAAYESMSYHQVTEAVMVMCSRGNLLLQEAAPWSALKNGTDAEKVTAAEVLCIVLEIARVAAVVLLPLTPALSGRCLQQLGLADSYLQELRWSHTAWGGLPVGHKLADAQPVFNRLLTPVDRAKLLEPAGQPPQKKGGKKNKTAAQKAEAKSTVSA